MEKDSYKIIGKSHKDEWYTPAYAVIPILEFISPDAVVWCPFDTKDSHFVKELQKNGNHVIYSHLQEGKDFFTYEPEQYDYIISNPPYSNKSQILKRLYELGKPFAMLMGLIGIFESKERFNLFKENSFEILNFDKRVSFFKDYSDQKPSLSPPFATGYVCSKFLPEKIMFKVLDRNYK